MIEKFFAPLNTYLVSHPAFLAKLKMLFWIKYWALTLLMVFFLFLIYKEQGGRRRVAPTAYDQKAYCFEA